MSCVALDYLKADLAEEIGNKRFDEGKDIATLNHIKNLMTTVKWTATQAMDALSIPPEDRKRYADKI